MGKVFATIMAVGYMWITSTCAQESWDLKRCIDHAIENNIQVKQSALMAGIAEQDLIQARGEALPTLNGFASHSYNFGQTIDRFTNQFAQDRVQSNAFSLNSSLTLFNGFQTINSIRQRQYTREAVKHDVDKMRNVISLQVANAYLAVLFAQEQLGIAQGQAQQSERQLQQVKKLVAAGSIAKGDQLAMEAQLAGDQLTLVNASNQLSLAYLDLQQLLELEPSEEFHIIKPDINLPDEPQVATTPGQVYDAGLRTLPEIKSAEYRLLSSERTYAVAKGTRSPQLVLSASYGTGYSGARKDIVDLIVNGYDSTITTASGEPVLTPLYQYEYETVSFGSQFNDNLNQTVGLNLTIPIFNGWAARTSIARARLGMERSRYDLELARNLLRKNVEQAHSDAVAALKKYHATQASMEALRESFQYAEQRFNAGMLTAVDFNDAKNKLARAEADLLQAKYEYVFKTKVLDFYQGKSLAFN